MSVRIVRLGSPRLEGEGLRIGTVRRPPRGVPKAEFASRNYYDVWLPTLSPSPELVTQALAVTTDAQWRTVARKMHAELNHGDAAKVLDVLAALSATTDFSVGCYCEHENRCHRSVLRQLLADRGAVFAEDTTARS
ncbi:DUF488 domain-containing protein [Bordetella genomosp. 4]|uniref:DUF488 domain-containing protein n=1 Tax=Bordetella genomosp. 4 TaxID=463044 RepID=A0A261TUP8_9BORD|nr:DUF488 family protein [Bordetella genomosp. 4]OZI45240.1 hypothetical protein CAL21_16155 [Bordetella genomosp. 4]OZI53135.1 hypothetical protein CAL20_19255 [Bordetella genomosp. 4]